MAVNNANTRGITGWCIEVHDLVVSKCIAGREKDQRFLEAAHEAGLVDVPTLRDRLATTPAESALLKRARPWIDRLDTNPL